MKSRGPESRRLLTLALTVAVTVVAHAGAAWAGAPGGFSGAELKAIRPLFGQYDVVSLAETDAAGSPKAMTLAIRVDAPKAEAFAVFEDPEKFSYISRLIAY